MVKKISFIVVFLMLICTHLYADPIAAYFVIPAGLYSNNQVLIPEPTVSNVVISEGNLDPSKCYQIRSIELSFPNNKGYQVGDRFTGIGADITGKGTVSEVTGPYWIKKRKFDSSPILGTTNSGKVIVNLLLKPHWVKAAKQIIQGDAVTIEDQILAARLQNAYIGRTRASVIAAYPELDGGELIEGEWVYRLTKHEWSFER
jgi:hypothetical protein